LKVLYSCALADRTDLQERAKLAQDLDSHYFYGDSEGNFSYLHRLTPDDMDDMETDDEESIVESSPYS
jgi:hypothetical protein